MNVFVVEPRGSGGMIHYAYQLCKALSEHDTAVTLVTANNYEMDGLPHNFQVIKLMNLWGRDNPISAAVSHRWIQATARKIYRSIRRVFRGIKLFLQWIKLTNYLLKQRPDIVQFGAIEFPFESVFLRYLKARGLILSQICHEFEPRERGAGFLVRLNNSLLKNVFGAFSIMFFHSKSNEERFSKLYPEISDAHFVVIPMGNGQIFPVTTDPLRMKESLLKKYNFNAKNPIVLFFGNITPSKGVPDLLQAFEKVHNQNTHTRLVIAGMPLKYINMNELFELASALEIQHVTKFEARYLPMDEVGPLIELARVVVFPYISSTQSASIQAAYAFGKPVVATRVGGLPDVVDEGMSGFLVEPNSPEEMAQAILKIINNPILAEKMGTYAKELSETRFAWGPIAGKIASVYREYLINICHHDGIFERKPD
jgi:glycosyltransferase involved in cell wall biosynthesis